MKQTNSFKKLFKAGTDASKGQDEPFDKEYRERILQVVDELMEQSRDDLDASQLNDMAIQMIIKDEVEKVIKNVQNAGFHTLDIVRTKYPRKEK